LSSESASAAVANSAVLTIGTYDGVHLGHQRLISVALAEGRRRRLPTVVVTFDRLPSEILRPSATPKLLTGLEHKLELLEATHVDALRVLHFDLERAEESAEDFIADYLVGQLGAAAVYVGANFRFGHRALGDVEMLQRLSGRFGYDVGDVELLRDEASHTIVSSTLIRRLVGDGDLREAAVLLGRPHEVRGSLVPDRRGVVVPGAFALPPAGRYEVLVGAPREEGVPATARLLHAGGSAAEVLLSFVTIEGPLASARPGAAVAVRFSS
jgi:riboflavin kinase/FMN adenylyltransferase